MLDKFYKPEMLINEAEPLGVAIIKQVMEEKIKPEIIDIFVLKKGEQSFVKRSLTEIQRLLTNLPNVE